LSPSSILTSKAENRITDDNIAKIKDLNSLDIKLYDFAKRLFLERVKVMREEIERNALSPLDVNIEDGLNSHKICC
jgi:hypothetical protein